MYSAGGFWNDGTWRRRGWPGNPGMKWLDCGGYTMFQSVGEYPFSPDEYLNLVPILKPDFYATMDYPCEPSVTRNLGKLSNADRIKATTDNAIAILDLESSVGYGTAVPVIQGYEPWEYMESIDQHVAAGTIRPYMAVGSMCRRLSANELYDLVTGIGEAAYSAGVKRLHWFGMKLYPALADLFEFIWSQDSAAVLDDYSSRDKSVERRWPKGQDEKMKRVFSFLDRVGDIGYSYMTDETYR